MVVALALGTAGRRLAASTKLFDGSAAVLSFDGGTSSALALVDIRDVGVPRVQLIVLDTRWFRGPLLPSDDPHRRYDVHATGEATILGPALIGVVRIDWSEQPPVVEVGLMDLEGAPVVSLRTDLDAMQDGITADRGLDCDSIL